MKAKSIKTKFTKKERQEIYKRLLKDVDNTFNDSHFI